MIQIETDGMSNSGGRTIQFADQYGTVLSSVTYEKADVKAGQSVAYAYGPGQVEMYKVGLFEKGTPGLQEPFQVPLEPVKQPEQDEITIEHTAPGTHTEKEDLTITATIKGGENVQNVAVLYTQDGKLAYKKFR